MQIIFHKRKNTIKNSLFLVFSASSTTTKKTSHSFADILAKCIIFKNSLLCHFDNRPTTLYLTFSTLSIVLHRVELSIHDTSSLAPSPYLFSTKSYFRHQRLWTYTGIWILVIFIMPKIFRVLPLTLAYKLLPWRC